MTVVAEHLGPVSGLTHFHLLRQSAAARSQAAERPRVQRAGTPPEHAATLRAVRPGDANAPNAA
jgi:hypothetical protein